MAKNVNPLVASTGPARAAIVSSRRWRLGLARRLRTRGKDAFIKKIVAGGQVLDVGCGNNSPFQFKSQRPDLCYVGIDVVDYNQTRVPTHYADRYILTNPEEFARAINSYSLKCDAVVCSHNLEHCLHPQAVLEAMLGALKPGGSLYLAFPCEASVGFPKRRGCLNFHDDATHRIPPEYDKVLATIKSAGLTIEFCRRRYRPLILCFLGVILEPVSGVLKANMLWGSTWALYGFESIIWASRPVVTL